MVKLNVKTEELFEKSYLKNKSKTKNLNLQVKSLNNTICGVIFYLKIRMF